MITKAVRLLGMILFIVCAVGAVTDLCAKVLTLKSSKRFDRMIAKKPLSVVMFYHENKRRCSDQCDSAIKVDPQVTMTGINSMYQQASESLSYKDADVQFFRVNITGKGFEELGLNFGIKKVPAWILFRYGSVVRDANKDDASILTGDIDYKQLRGFINKHLRGDIEERIERKAAERERRRESSSAVYFGVGYPAYAPYYGYGPGASVGFGFSI